MNWDELKNTFPSWDKANSMTWDLTRLDKYELIARAENGSILLPTDVQNNLRSLCTELAKASPEKTPYLSALNFKTIGDAIKVMTAIVKIIQITSDLQLWEKLVNIYEVIISYLEQ